MDHLILGVAGPARSGKSTLARYLREDHGFFEITFAGPIKQACATLFKWSAAQLHGPKKEEFDP